MLQKKQILSEVLVNTWKTFAKNSKLDYDNIYKQLKQKNAEAAEKSKDPLEDAQGDQIKDLNLKLLEQKSNHITYLEISIKQMREEITQDYCGLPPDLNQAKQRIYELEQLLKFQKSKQ